MVFLLIHRLRSRFLSFSLSLSPLSSFYVCRHIQRAIHKLKFIVFFKMNVCFCKKQLAMQVPAKRNAGCSTGFECLISHWLTRRGGRTYVRTYVRSDISDVITLPNFFACMHLLYSLTHGASLRAARCARSSATIFSYPWCFAASCARSSAIIALATVIVVSLAAVFSIVTQRSSPQEEEERCVTRQRTAARETTLIAVSLQLNGVLMMWKIKQTMQDDTEFVRRIHPALIPVTGLKCSYGKIFSPLTEIPVGKTEISGTEPAHPLK